MERTVEELTEVSWKIAFRVFLSFMWRAVVWGAALGLLNGLLAQLVIKTALGQEGYVFWMVLSVPFFILVPNLMALKAVLRKRYGGFRVMVVKS